MDRAIEGRVGVGVGVGGSRIDPADRAGLRAFVSSDRKQLRVNNARPACERAEPSRVHLRKCARADMAVPVFDCTADDDNLQSR